MTAKHYPLKNGETVLIRRAREADLDGYRRVSDACYRETRFLSRCAEDTPPGADELLDYLRELADAPDGALLVAEYGGRIVGFGDVAADRSRRKMRHKCDLTLVVLRECWRLGIGSALLDALIGFARAAGFEHVNLNVAHDNERAIRLYARFGFQPTGREVHAMKHGEGDYSDFIHMIRFLTDRAGTANT